MASDGTEQEGTPTAGRKGGVLLVAAIMVGLGVGGAGGAFVLAPLLGSRAVSTAHAQESPHGQEPADSTGCPGGTAGEQVEAPPKSLHTVDNLVLNPARSGGTRFLLASVAIGLRDETTAAELKTRDAEVRDVLLGVLGSKTVAELAEVTGRDSLRAELRDRLSTMVKGNAIQQVYFPQFVIQ